MNSDTKQYIIKHLEGRLSSEEKAVFDEKYSKDTDFRKEVDDYSFIWRQTELLKQHKQYRTQANWQKISQRIHRDRLRMRIWNVSRTAAAILLLPLLAATVYLSLWRLPSKMHEEIRISSAYGLVSHVTLPDGSEVWLNSGTTLTYPRVFDGEVRRVSLSGEAYFKVKSDPEHRFDVAVPNLLTVSAYGTEFNVSAYDDDNAVETVLTQGHVELTAESRVLADLCVGQSAVLERSGHLKPLISIVNMDEKVGWKDGKLIFRRAGIEEIAKRLARHFGVEFELRGDRLRAYEYSATFTTESLAEILSLLGKASPMNVQIIEPQKQNDHSYPRRKVILSIGY